MLLRQISEVSETSEIYPQISVSDTYHDPRH